METLIGSGFTLLVAVVFVYLISRAFKIIRPYESGLVERLGKFASESSPGLNVIIPGVDRLITVDMREQVIDVPPQEVITKDNVNITVDAVIYYEATDPQKLVYNVGDCITAATKLAQTNLRNVVGDLELDAALTSRETINTQLKSILDEATDNPCVDEYDNTMFAVAVCNSTQCKSSKSKIIKSKPLNSVKNYKFSKLISKRLPRAQNAIKLVGNLSRRSSYKYTDEEAQSIIKSLSKAMRDLRKKFK